jgi:tetratricopeptide (TPR) repeat protein
MTNYAPLQLAEIFIQTGELADALEALDAHLSAEPDSERGRRLRAEVLARLPDDESARRALDDLDALQTRFSTDVILRSALLETLGDLAGAVAAVAEGISTFPGDDRLVERQLHLLRSTGQTAQARAVIESLLADGAEDWRWLAWSGDLAVDAGDSPAAVDYYSRAIDRLQARYHFSPGAPASILIDGGASEAAALTVAAQFARLRLARGHVRRAQSDWPSAEADYTAAQALLPGDRSIGYYRGLVAAGQGRIDEAVALCQDALGAVTPLVREQLAAALESVPSAAADQLRARLTL